MYVKKFLLNHAMLLTIKLYLLKGFIDWRITTHAAIHNYNGCVNFDRKINTHIETFIKS